MVGQKLNILLLTGILSLFSISLFAQKFTASVNKKSVSVNEVISVTFRASGSYQQISDLKFPSFDGFQVLGQPQRFSSSSNINGVVNTQYDFTISIRPLKKGILTIGSATVKLDGKKYLTKSIPITVNKASNNQNKSKTEKKKKISNKEVFTKTIVSRTNIYKGEAISVIQKVYSRKEIINFKDLVKPQYEGFLVENDEVRQYQVKVEVVDGIQYYVVVLEKRKLFAQKAGKLKIVTPSLTVIMREIKTRDWYGRRVRYAEELSKKLYSVPTYIQVKQLVNEPAGFEDLVGSFSLDVSIDKTTTKINDPITLKIKLSGTGNHHLLSEFKLDLPDDIETYEPKIKQNLSLTNNGFNGYKSFEYLLVPRKAGNFNLPSIKLVYFNVKSGTYKTLSNDQIQIKVEKGEGNYSGDLPTGLSKKEIELRGKDIHFIKQELGAFTWVDNHFVGSFIFWLYYIIPAIIFLLFIIFYKRFSHFRNDVVLFRQKKASSASNKKLKKAKKMLSANNKSGFFEEVSNAVYGYLGDKLILSAAELSREKASEILLSRNVNQELIKDLFDLLDECEFARFAPSSNADNLNTTYQNALNLLTKLEKEIAK